MPPQTSSWWNAESSGRGALWRWWQDSALWALLQRLVNAGVKNTDDTILQRKIRFLNTVCCFLIAYTALLTPQFSAVGLSSWGRTLGVQMACCVLYASIIAMNHLGWFKVSRVVLLFGAGLALWVAILLGQGTALLTHYMFIACALVTFSFYKVSEWRASLAISGVFIALFVYFELAGWPGDARVSMLTQDQLLRMRITKTATYLGLTMLMMVLSEKAVNTLAARLQLQGRTDLLTGLPNRRGFQTALQMRVRTAQRTQQSFGIALIDLDHFKQMNDTHGHAVGDEALAHIAQTLQRCMRAGDFAARTGGEEFVVLLAAHHLDAALGTVERLRNAIAGEAVPTSVGALRLTISVGLTMWRGDGQTVDSALREADQALYQAKRLGRDRVCLAPAVPRGEPHA